MKSIVRDYFQIIININFFMNMITPLHYEIRNTSIKKFCKRISFLRWLYKLFNTFLNKDLLSLRAKVENLGYGSYRKMIIGSSNKIIIGYNTSMSDTLFHIVGHNNTIRIGDNCIIGVGCSFWMEGDNIIVDIGDRCTFTRQVHLNAQETSRRIIIGENCMFSNHITVRTSDSHPIYSIHDNERINPAKDVIIGSNVWIAPDSKIMKGAVIGDNCIIGSNTIVNKGIPPYCLAVGMPAKIVKEGVYWTRENIVNTL